MTQTKQQTDTEAELVYLRAEMQRWRRIATDRQYMIDALVPMLGPKARQVWDHWQENRVQRIHFDWGPVGAITSGEERAQIHLDLIKAESEAELIEDFDEHITRQRESSDIAKGKPTS
jgi:hypothetical protein